MNYNFDEIINRKGTDYVKWDAVEGRWGRNDLIPMWVADMDSVSYTHLDVYKRQTLASQKRE